MPVSFSDFLLSLRADPARTALLAFDPDATAVRLPRVRRACFHLVLEGEAEIRLHDTGNEVRLVPGDFALLIRGDGHDLGCADAAVVSLGEEAFSSGEEPAGIVFGTPRTQILTGQFGLEQIREEAPTTAIPSLLVTPFGSEPAYAGMFTPAGRDHVLEQVHGPGGRAAIGTLLRLFYIETIRRAFQRISVNDPSGLRKLGISQIAAARRLIHAEPGRTWTLEQMARSVGMSRSVFARRFHEVTGETPQAYLAGVRFEKATHLIESGASIAEASAHVGYASPSAFARAFTRRRGRPPSRAVQRPPQPLS